MTKDQWVMVLTFVASLISLAASTLALPPTVTPYLVFAVGVINLALAVFFGVNKPVAASFKAGAESVK